MLPYFQAMLLGDKFVFTQFSIKIRSVQIIFGYLADLDMVTSGGTRYVCSSVDLTIYNIAK